MKPFDLAAALAGEPVVLRNGETAFVLKKLQSRSHNSEDIVGYRLTTDEYERPVSWSASGEYYENLEHDFDIVGMWGDPKPTLKIGDMDVPEPEREPLEKGETYYVPELSFSTLVSSDTWDGFEFDLCRLERGLVHKTREAAEQHAKALIGLVASKEGKK